MDIEPEHEEQGFPQQELGVRRGPDWASPRRRAIKSTTLLGELSLCDASDAFNLVEHMEQSSGP